jgi:hypothetical protein
MSSFIKLIQEVDFLVFESLNTLFLRGSNLELIQAT